MGCLQRSLSTLSIHLHRVSSFYHCNETIEGYSKSYIPEGSGAEGPASVLSGTSTPSVMVFVLLVVVIVGGTCVLSELDC